MKPLPSVSSAFAVGLAATISFSDFPSFTNAFMRFMTRAFDELGRVPTAQI
jgi:hypothetical protein